MAAEKELSGFDGMSPLISAKSVPIKLKSNPEKKRDVYPWFEITVQNVDVTKQTWNASVEIHLFWQNISLPAIHPKFEEVDFILGGGDVPIKLTEVFENKIHEGIESLEYKYYPETSTVHMFLVIQVKFVERMELQRFPLDRQFLGMDFNGWVGEEQGNWNWITKAPSWVPKQFDKQFAVRMLSTVTEYEMLTPWIDFSVEEQPISIRLRVARLPSFYLSSIVLPNFLIVTAAFASFPITIDDEDKGYIADRLSVSVTLMLTAVAFRYVITEQLPKVNYLTIMDYYLLLGFIMLTLLIAENAIVGIPPSTLSVEQRKLIDNITLIVFAVIWGGTHLWWLCIIYINEFMRVSWERMDELDSDDSDEWKLAPKQKMIGNEASKQCLDEWDKFKNKSYQIRASVYQEEHPELLKSDTEFSANNGE